MKNNVKHQVVNEQILQMLDGLRDAKETIRRVQEIALDYKEKNIDEAVDRIQLATILEIVSGLIEIAISKNRQPGKSGMEF